MTSPFKEFGIDVAQASERPKCVYVLFDLGEMIVVQPLADGPALYLSKPLLPKGSLSYNDVTYLGKRQRSDAHVYLARLREFAEQLSRVIGPDTSEEGT
jgi:hypothetical protein